MRPGDERFGHNWAGPVPAVDHPLHFNVGERASSWRLRRSGSVASFMLFMARSISSGSVLCPSMRLA